MAQNDCKAQFVTAVLKFKATVHVEGEKAYKELITDLKEISLQFVDDLEGASIPVVLHSIKRRDGHHFKQSLTVHHEQQRFDPYAAYMTRAGTRRQRSWCPTSSSMLGMHQRH